MSLPKVAVVILNWNGSELLKKFLPSVINGSKYANTEIWVADNASTDMSINILKDEFPQVKIAINNGNLGYAGGYNEALKKIDADYYVLLNSDVEVSAGWITPVIEMMESDKNIAACQPKIRAYNNKAYFEYAGAAGGFIDTLGYPFCRGRVFHRFEKDNGQYDNPTEIFWASGACLFLNAAAFQNSGGGFDEDFFAHMEEIDLCWRLKNMGYKIMFCPKSIVYHVGGGTLNSSHPKKTYLNFRNNRLMIIKNLPFSQSIKIYFVRNILDFVAFLQALFSGYPKSAFAILKALFYVHKNIFYWLNKKKKVLNHINQNSIGEKNVSGVLKDSLVFNYFIKRNKNFKQIVKE